MKVLRKSRLTAWVLLMLVFTLPLQSCKFGLTNNVTDTLNHAITQLRPIIAQLESSSTKVLGVAGEQLRASVREVTTSTDRLLQSLERTTGGIANQMEGAVTTVLSEITKDAAVLLTLTDDLVRNNVKCLDEVIAKRIQQTCDNAVRLIKEISKQINYTVNNVFRNATDFVKVGSTEVALLASRGVTMALRAVLLLFALGISIWLLRKNQKGEASGRKSFFTPFNIIASLLIAGSIYLLINPLLVWVFLGYAKPVPFNPNGNSSELICEKSITSYSKFLNVYENNPAQKSAYEVVGLIALDDLDRCAYLVDVQNIAERREKMAEKINTILFPAPSIKDLLLLAECKAAPSVDPRALSNRVETKINIMKELVTVGEVKTLPPSLPSTDKTQGMPTPPKPQTKPKNMEDLESASERIKQRFPWKFPKDQ